VRLERAKSEECLKRLLTDTEKRQARRKNFGSTEEEALEKVVSHFAPDMRTPRGDSWFFTCKQSEDKLKPLPKHYNTVQIKHHFRKYTEQEK